MPTRGGLPVLNAETLRSLLAYDEVTGKFINRVARGKKIKPGSLAGSVRNGGNGSGGGYLVISIDYMHHYAHRLAWLYVTGKWPNHEIDHIDGDRLNNAFSNLRDIKHASNIQNQKAVCRSDNKTTGLRGVSPAHQGSGFTAVIHVNRRRIHLGTFGSKEVAHQAYLDAKRLLHQGSNL